MLFDFYRFINSPNEYLECYSTFLMTNKDLKKNILNHRMNVLINSYLNDKNKNKFDYYYYYLSNHKDNYLERPLLSKEVINIKDDNDDYDQDVIDHYKFLIAKPQPKPVIDYDKIDEKFYEEEYLKEIEKMEKEMNNYEYYDDYDDYDDYNDYEEIEEFEDNESYYEDY